MRRGSCIWAGSVISSPRECKRNEKLVSGISTSRGWQHLLSAFCRLGCQLPDWMSMSYTESSHWGCHTGLVTASAYPEALVHRKHQHEELLQIHTHVFKWLQWEFSWLLLHNHLSLSIQLNSVNTHNARHDSTSLMLAQCLELAQESP